MCDIVIAPLLLMLHSSEFERTYFRSYQNLSKWYSDPISIPLSLKTLKNTFSQQNLIKSAISGQIIDFYFFSIFSIFFHLFQQMLIGGFTEMWMGVVMPKNGNFERFESSFNLYLSHFEQLEPNIQNKKIMSPGSFKCRQIVRIRGIL